MVIPTEYRGQRYSMGSSDPLPSGFEIRFGSLNFQAIENGYPMCITNRNELHPWRSTRPGPVPVTPAADAPTPAQADAVGPSTPRRPGQRSRQARMERRRAVRVASQRDATTSKVVTAPAGERAVPEPQFPHGMRNAAMAYASSISTDVAACRGHPSRHLLAARNLTTSTTAPAVSCHPPLGTGTRSGTSPAYRTR
jgi:hypothetical protein